MRSEISRQQLRPLKRYAVEIEEREMRVEI
jgi:hypothetical protein